MANSNYPSLRQMFEKYNKDGFEIIAFPVNQFGCQGPLGSAGEREKAKMKFKIDGDGFHVMDEIAVRNKGTSCKVVDPARWEEYKDDPDAALMAPLIDDPIAKGPADPLYEYLKAQTGGEDIPWNYTKFLVGRDGKVIKRYSPRDPLEQGLESDLKKALAT